VLDDVRYPEALRFIEECENRRVPILGFEWFRRDGETVTPVGIADFSTALPRRDGKRLDGSYVTGFPSEPTRLSS
jgi:hypothetical protein